MQKCAIIVDDHIGKCCEYSVAKSASVQPRTNRFLSLRQTNGCPLDEQSSSGNYFLVIKLVATKVAVIGNLGRPGLKFEQFSILMEKIGFNVPDEMLTSVFLSVDLDQSSELFIRPRGGSAAGRPNFGGLVLGWIDADFAIQSPFRFFSSRDFFDGSHRSSRM